MRKRVKWGILIGLAALLVAGLIALSSLTAAGVQPPGSLLCDVTEVGEDSVTLRLTTASSALHYSHVRHRVEGDRLYIRAYYGLAGGAENGEHVELAGDFSGIREIYLEGGGAQELVWRTQDP